MLAFNKTYIKATKTTVFLCDDKNSFPQQIGCHRIYILVHHSTEKVAVHCNLQYKLSIVTRLHILCFSKGKVRFKKAIAKKMQKFNSFFTKAFIVFTTFTEKEGQIINFIKTNEISVIILMRFTIALRKALT